MSIMKNQIQIKSIRYVPAANEKERMKKIVRLLLSFAANKNIHKDVQRVDQGRDR